MEAWRSSPGRTASQGERVSLIPLTLLSIVALMIMLFFAVVSTQGRLLAGTAAMVVSFVLYRDLKILRRWRPAN